MSNITYNGIELSLVKTRLIGRDQVRSQDGSDVLYIKHTFDVDCVYNPYATSYESGPNQQHGLSPAITDDAIRLALMAPRQQLTYSINDDVVLSSPEQGSTVDAFVGPMPISCNVKEIVGTKTWIVSYRIETWINECATADEAADDPVVSSRFQVDRSVDRQRLTTLTTSGISVFRMDALESANQCADHFLTFLVPSVPTGFQRQAIDVKVNSIGNTLFWVIQDREMMYYLGDTFANQYGVEWCEATFSQVANPPEGGGANKQSIFIHATFQARVVGNKNALKANLITFAVSLAIQRCAIKAGPVIGKDPLIRQISVSEVLTDRIIDLTLVTMYPPSNIPNAIGLGGIQGQYLGIDILTLLNDPDLGNLQMPNDDNTRGTFDGEALASVLKEACLASPSPDKDQPSSPGDSTASTTDYQPPTVSVSVVDNLETQAAMYSDDTASEGLYTEYSVQASYDRNWGVIACSVSTMPNSSSSSGGSGSLNPSGMTLPGQITYYPPEILTVSSPIQYVKFSWVVERNGTVPNIPDWDLSTANLTLMSDSVRPAEQYLAPDGQTPVFRIEGLYTYCRNTAEDMSVSFPFPIVPWTSFDYGQYSITEENVVHGILDDPNSSTGSDGGGGEDDNPPGTVL